VAGAFAEAIKESLEDPDRPENWDDLSWKWQRRKEVLTGMSPPARESIYAGTVPPGEKFQGGGHKGYLTGGLAEDIAPGKVEIDGDTARSSVVVTGEHPSYHEYMNQVDSGHSQASQTPQNTADVVDILEKVKGEIFHVIDDKETMKEAMEMSMKAILHES
jgi:hypothetical protein